MASALGGEELVEQLPIPIGNPDAGLDEVSGEGIHAGQVVEEIEIEAENGDEK